MWECSCFNGQSISDTFLIKSFGRKLLSAAALLLLYGVISNNAFGQQDILPFSRGIIEQYKYIGTSDITFLDLIMQWIINGYILWVTFALLSAEMLSFSVRDLQLPWLVVHNPHYAFGQMQVFYFSIVVNWGGITVHKVYFSLMVILPFKNAIFCI